MTYNTAQIKILIVEDMQPMLTLTVTLLKMLGFQNIHGAKDVKEGYNLFCQHSHDIVITDWLMEPMDGLDLIKMIRTEDTSPNRFVPIILMTGYSDQPRVETARDTGVTEFLMKPYSARDLYARIVQIIEKPRQFVETETFFGPSRRRRKNSYFYGVDKRNKANKNLTQNGNPEKNEEMDIILRDLKSDTQKI